MFVVKFTDSYHKVASKWIKRHPDLKQKYFTTLKLLELNPYHNSLRLHKLSGHLSDFYSISIDMRYRILLDFIIQDNEIILLNIGTHDIYNN